MCLTRPRPAGLSAFLLIRNTAILRVFNGTIAYSDGLDVTKLGKRIRIEKRKKKNYFADV